MELQQRLNFRKISEKPWIDSLYSVTVLIDRLLKFEPPIPKSVIARGRPTIAYWLYKLIREDGHEDARKNVSHDTALSAMLNQVFQNPPVDLEPLVGRMLSKAGRKAAAKKNQNKY